MRRAALLLLLLMGFPAFYLVSVYIDPGPGRLLAQLLLVAVLAFFAYLSIREGRRTHHRDS